MFVKGQSGNPGGRAKGRGEFREAAREFMDSKGVLTLLAMAAEDGEDRRFALKVLAEYAYGKPQQHVDVSASGPLIKAYIGVDLDKV